MTFCRRTQKLATGHPTDGPRAELCAPSQRVRLSPVPSDPNCVERAAIYVGVAELLEPDAVRQLKTTLNASRSWPQAIAW